MVQFAIVSGPCNTCKIPKRQREDLNSPHHNWLHVAFEHDPFTCHDSVGKS